MAKYVTRIEADKKQCPVLLSNGNLVDEGQLDNGRYIAATVVQFKSLTFDTSQPQLCRKYLLTLAMLYKIYCNLSFAVFIILTLGELGMIHDTICHAVCSQGLLAQLMHNYD